MRLETPYIYDLINFLHSFDVEISIEFTSTVTSRE